MKKILLSLIGILCTMSMWAAEQTSSFSLVTYTVTDGKATITSSDNTNVSLTLGRDGGNIGAADSKSRGFRVQTNMYFEITVPEGKYIKKVDFTANNNGNLSKADDTDGKFGIWSITGDVNTWVLSAKAVTYTWTNGGTNLSSPMKFKQTGNGDIYVSAVKVYYDDAPQLSNVAPTIATQPTNKTTVTGVATTLSMAADGIPTPAIQWYSCDDAQKTNAQAIQGATSSSYNFQTSTAGTYYFYAVASNTEGDATTNVVSVTVNQAYVMTFAKDDANIIGTIPAAIRSNGELKVTTPKCNYSLYLADKTFTHWTDGVNNYLPNTEYTLSSNVTVTPVFADNATSLDRLTSTTTVNFIKSTSVAATYQSSNQNAVVEQLTDNGKTIDVALIIQNGKFDLQPANSRAQTNNGTVVTIPVIDGATVVINIYDNNSTKNWDCTINNESVESYLSDVDTNVKKMTYTYHGAATSIDYVVNAGNMYANNIDVTYPGLFDKTVVYNWNTVGTTTLAGTATTGTVKVKNVNTNGIKFGNGLSADNYLKIESNDGGFKAGDVVTWTGCINNSDKSKQGAIMIVSNAADGNVQLTCSELFNNTNDAAVAATTGSFTLTEDADCLYIGRATSGLSGATATWLTQLTVSRTAATTSPILNASGYATFSYGHDVRVTGAKAYKATIDGNNLVCEEIANGLVPAGEGVLLYGEAGATVTALFSGSAPAVTENDLKATTLADGSLKDINEVTSEKVLVLSGDTFVPYATGNAFAANKAYLPYDAPAGAKSLRIVFGGNTTGINTAAATQKVANAKFIENGRIVIVKDGAKYNVAGQVIK